jgi:hypothetical protein
VRAKFMRIEVIKSVLIGPVNPRAGIISRGKMMRFTQNTPSGGIQAVLRIRATVSVDCDTYSIHALQNIVSRRLIIGITTHPNRANRSCDSDGKKRASPKLKRVSITPCTMPNVIRRAY